MTTASRPDISKLSKEEKIRLLEALEEKERRKRASRTSYRPNPGQLPVHESPHLIRCVFSGNGAGKTTLAVNETMWAVNGFNPITKVFTPVPCKAIVVLDKGEKVDDKWVPEIRKWFGLRDDQCHKRGRHHINLITFDNGSEIQFLFHDQKELTFESIEANFVVFDEPPPRHIYIGLRRAGREKGKKARYLIVGTPLSAAWLRREIWEPWSKGEAADVMCFKFHTEVNKPNLADGYIEEFSAILSDKERAIRLAGDFFDLDGLALAHLFRRDMHILRRNEYQWDDSYPAVVSIDYHPSKPVHACIVGADDIGPVWLKSLKLKLPARQFARELKKWYQGYRLLDIVCDDAGSAESTGGEGFKSFIQILVEEGVRVRPTNYADKHDEDWVTRIADALLVPDEGPPLLRILDGNEGIVSDIENVQWTKYRNLEVYKPTLDIENKDWLACLKYALACNISIKRRKPKVNYVSRKVYGFDPPKPKRLRLTVGALKSKQRDADD